MRAIISRVRPAAPTLLIVQMKYLDLRNVGTTPKIVQHGKPWGASLGWFFARKRTLLRERKKCCVAGILSRSPATYKRSRHRTKDRYRLTAVIESSAATDRFRPTAVIQIGESSHSISDGKLVRFGCQLPGLWTTRFSKWTSFGNQDGCKLLIKPCKCRASTNIRSLIDTRRVRSDQLRQWR